MTTLERAHQPKSPELTVMPKEAVDSFIISLNRYTRYLNGEIMHTHEGLSIEDEAERTRHFEAACELLEGLTPMVTNHMLVVYTEKKSPNGESILNDNGNVEKIVVKALENFQGLRYTEDELVVTYRPRGGETIEEFGLKGLGTEFKLDVI